MGWANQYIAKLLNGESVSFRPHGNSMQGKVENGDLITIEPIKDYLQLQIDDIVLCKVNGKQYVHLIKSIGSDGRFQIGNNKGHINGWISSNSIYGICVKVEK